MEGVVGAEVSQKIRAAIKAKLMEIGVYVDEELPDYVMVMVANKRSKEQMDEDLELFLGKHTSLFTLWLHSVLQKLQEVTVANLGIKKKSGDESKKKKKSKDEKKVSKKKIKTEPIDVVSTSIKKEDESKTTDTENNKKSKNSSEEAVSSTKKQSSNEGTSKGIKKKTQIEDTKEEEIEPRRISGDATTSRSPTVTSREPSEEKLSAERKDSLDGSIQLDELEDEDCINIRTDGELLDTNEELALEEALLTSKDKEESPKPSSKESKKRTRSATKSPPRLKEKSQSISDGKSRKTSEKEVIKKQDPKSDDKLVDARELLNRKKAAKELESKARSKSRERSTSPQKRRKEDDRESNRRVYTRDGGRRGGRENDKESFSRRGTREDDDRDRRRSRERDSNLGKRRSDERFSRRTDADRIESRVVRRRSPSSEIPSKRVFLDKQARNKTDDLRTSRSTSRREEEDGRSNKRGLVSRVVARPQEPEEEMDTSVPSVVKITPRPSRPAGQGPSSTLILKAISEANRSLANAPPRPDSTQRTRKEPVITRTMRNQKVPPEKIAISITNHLALQNVPTAQDTEDEDMTEVRDEDDEGSRSPRYDETARNKSPSPSEKEKQQPEEEKSKKSKNNEKKQSPKAEEETQSAEVQESEDFELHPTQEEEDSEPREEASDPQFVVTLNGYDPDGLFVGMDVDGEGGMEGDEWMKEGILTSTPPSQLSPSKQNNSSSHVNVKTPAINHSNLIAVELKPKVTERCKFWPACKLMDKCTFYHPSKPCNMFPNCKFGDTCLYIHPQCKFNALCTRKDCIFAHTTAHTPLQPAAGPKAKTLYATSALLPCKFYPNCTNVNCQFAHPTRACRFGLYCTKKDCSFDHGQVAPIDKLKWTRVPTT